jgi:hypothetical protein
LSPARTLTAVEERAVAILARGPTTCARLGDELWGRNAAGNCSCPWARPAGALLKRLVRAGVVRRAHVPNDHATLYELEKTR